MADRRRKRRPAGRRRTRRRGVPRWVRLTILSGLVLGALGLAALAGYLFHLDRTITSTFEGRRWSVPAVIYAQPLELFPGAALSLQSHVHRSEHWIVVEGTALVTIDDRKQLVTENQSVYIPVGSIHRMENPGKVPMVLIEVQTGSYLGEDDIKRYEDVYARE